MNNRTPTSWSDDPSAVEERGSASTAESVMDLLYALRRRWWWIVIGGVTCLGAAWYAVSNQPRVYTAEALLRIKASSPLAAIGVTSYGGQPMTDYASQVAIIRSRAVLAGVVDSLDYELSFEDPRGAEAIEETQVDRNARGSSYRLELRNERVALMPSRSDSVLSTALPGEWLQGPDFRLKVASAEPLRAGPTRFSVLGIERAIDQLERRIRIEQGTAIDMIRVSYSDVDPERAADVANAVAEAFKDYRIRSANSTATLQREFLADQMLQLADSLHRAQDVLLQYQESQQLLNPQAEGNVLASALIPLENELRTLRFREGLLESLVVTGRSGTQNASDLQRVVAMGREVLPGGSDLYNRLQELQSQRTQLTASQYGYSETSPEVVEVDSLIHSTQRQIQLLAEESLRLVGQQREAVEAQVATLTQQLGGVPQRSIEFDRLQRQVDAIQTAFNPLVTKYYEAQLAEAVETGDVDIVDAAIVPLRPDPVHRNLNLAIALLVGMMLGAGGVGVRHYFDPTVQRTADAERASGLRAVGLIPHLDTGSQLRLSGDERGMEAFRMLLTNIRFSSDGQDKILVVTSAAPAEGKSTIAANLALALADQGSNVLLVDADLRRPVLHRVFNVDRAPGVSDVVEAHLAPDGTVRRDANRRVSILTCGGASDNPPALLASDAFRDFLQYARSHYDAIVVDTAPVLAVTDASVVSSLADQVLFVVRANKSDRVAVGRAMEQLRRGAQSTPAALVVTDIPADSVHGRQNYGYYQYVSHYTAEETNHPRRPRRWRPRLLGPGA